MNSNILYHYTHKNALISIIKNKVIWATDYKYLNMNDQIKKLYEKVKKYASDNTYTEKIADLSCSLPMNKGVFCLSEKGDMLSQWIHYGEYAIGFNIEALDKCLESHGFYKVKPCIYSDDEIDKLITKFFQNNNSIDIEYFLSYIGLIYKNSRSKDECEWRAVSSSHPLISNTKTDNWKIRITPSKKIIEYVDIDIEEYFPIEKIIISSEKNFEAEKEFLEEILYNNGINNIDIIKSSIPFRKI